MSKKSDENKDDRFEVGDSVTSGYFDGVEQVIAILSGPDDLYNVKTPSFCGPPELFQHATSSTGKGLS